jgi:hypothetical protein
LQNQPSTRRRVSIQPATSAPSPITGLPITKSSEQKVIAPVADDDTFSAIRSGSGSAICRARIPAIGFRSQRHSRPTIGSAWTSNYRRRCGPPAAFRYSELLRNRHVADRAGAAGRRRVGLRDPRRCAGRVIGVSNLGYLRSVWIAQRSPERPGGIRRHRRCRWWPSDKSVISPGIGRGGHQ